MPSGISQSLFPSAVWNKGAGDTDRKRLHPVKKMMHASLRREHQEDVKFSLKRGRGYQSDQSRIWNNISEKSARMNVESPTHAMADVYESYEDKLSEFINKFQLIEWQVGAVFAIDGQIVVLEGFGCHDTFMRFFDKLVKSYAIDAFDRRDKQQSKSVPPNRARNFIESALKSKGERHLSIGIGENITFESRMVSGAALVEKDRVLHLSAFRKEKRGHNSSIGFKRFSRRKRRR